MKRGTHVNWVPGAGEDAIIVHIAEAKGATADLQMPGGGIEPDIARREPKGGTYVAGEEDLGRTFHLID